MLPAHYFDELPDDLEFQEEDEEFLNTTSEMEKQYYLNQSKESGIKSYQRLLNKLCVDALLKTFIKTLQCKRPQR